jgi:hypothetical protein
MHFSRIDREEKIEYVVALNNSTSSDSATFKTDSPATTFKASISRLQRSDLTSTADGSLTVTVPALGFVIYRAEAMVAVPQAAAAISITTPTEGAEVSGGWKSAANVSPPATPK